MSLVSHENSKSGGDVKCLWVAAHVGAKGNMLVDELAEKAIKKGEIEMQISISRAKVTCVKLLG